MSYVYSVNNLILLSKANLVECKITAITIFPELHIWKWRSTKIIRSSHKHLRQLSHALLLAKHLIMCIISYNKPVLISSNQFFLTRVIANAVNTQDEVGIDPGTLDEY